MCTVDIDRKYINFPYIDRSKHRAGDDGRLSLTTLRATTPSAILTLPVPILLNASSLVIFSVHDIFNTLRYTHISKASSLDNGDFV